MTATQANITYGSSIDGALTTLKALVAYPSSASNLPVCAIMHGWSQQVSDLIDSYMVDRFAEGVYYTISGVSGSFESGEALSGSLGGAATCNAASADQIVPHTITSAFQVGEVVTGGTSGATATIASIASNNLFCIYPEMRGRNGASGAPDGGGREVQDIIDAIDHVLSNYPSETDASQIYIVGYSGGGGNAQSASVRFPDRFNAVVSFFGMADYGYSRNLGWWYTNPTYRVSLEEWIGATPLLDNNAYRSRASLLARRNYTNGHLYIYHDYDDTAVPVINAERIVNALNGLGYDNFTASLTDASMPVRWFHESPTVGESVILAERDFLPLFSAKSYDAWTVPASGTLITIGWIDTSRFALWVEDGTDTYAEVTYNTTSRVFTIKPTTAVDIVLSLKGQTPAAGITTTINGAQYTETADGNGVAEYSISIQPLETGADRAINMRTMLDALPNANWRPG